MNTFVATIVCVKGNSTQSPACPKAIARNSATARVKVEVGNGAVAPKVAIQRAKLPVRVEIGNGASPRL